MSKITDAMVQALLTEFAYLEDMKEGYARDLLEYYINTEDPYDQARNWILHGDERDENQNQNQTNQNQTQKKNQDETENQTKDDQDQAKNQNQNQAIEDQTKVQNQAKDQDQNVDGGFEIAVRSLDLKYKFSLFVKSSDTFGIVKTKIQGKLGYFPNQQHIVYRSKIVQQNNHTLEERRILRNGTIFLVIVLPALSNDSIPGINGWLWKGPTDELFSQYGPPADESADESPEIKFNIQSGGRSAEVSGGGSGGFPSNVAPFSPSIPTVNIAIEAAAIKAGLQEANGSASTGGSASADVTGSISTGGSAVAGGTVSIVTTGGSSGAAEAAAGGLQAVQGGFRPQAFGLDTPAGQNRVFNDMCPTCAHSCNAVLLNGVQPTRRVDCRNCNKSYLLNPRVGLFQEVGFRSEVVPQ